MKLGVDLGGVIIDSLKNDGTDTAFKGDNYLKTTAVPESFSSLRTLNKRFNGLVYVVSTCGLTTELKARDWMKYHRFYEVTEVSPTNIYYCRTKEEKAPICGWLDITHFIDDHLEVLSYLDSVRNKYLFGPQNGNGFKKYSAILPLIIKVDSWRNVLEEITS